jgi:hypothetical protein
VPALEAATQAATSLAAALERGSLLTVGTAELLTGRAALLRLGRRGRTSANGSCRLLAASDGWVAVNLARPSDVDAVPALIERPVIGDTWAALTTAVARLPSATVVERATLLEVPAAALPEGGGDVPARPLVASKVGAPRPEEASPARLVVDLSAMWAGPLCARLLGLAGLRVVKVETPTRPDGARGGDARFFSWLHGGHESVAVDLSSDEGRRSLRALIDRADVVIESSRPRALAQLGIDAEEVVASRPGVTWVSITGYGRRDGAAHRVAFGDDAAVAAGLVASDERGDPVCCGDAIADPIAGLYAAVGALASRAAGGGHLLDVAMVGATSFAASVPVVPATAVEAGPGQWQVPVGHGLPPQPVAQPAPPVPHQPAARPLGADTARVLAEVGGADTLRSP